MRPLSCRSRSGLEFCSEGESGSVFTDLWSRFGRRTNRDPERPEGKPLLLAKTFSAYVARQFFAWFCGVFLAMVFITFLLDYLELIRRGGAKVQATLWLLFEMAVLKLPHTAQEVLPFAVLFGTMLAFWRLTRNHELVVARAAGVSVWQFLTPAVLAALLIGVIAVTVFNPIASLMEAAYEKLDSRILRQGSDQLSLSDTGLWLRQSDQA